MELYAKGQLSFLILNCLLERDFYGLDIISEISSRSNGNINLKKPSVYSNLTRMEKQGFVSAYLKSSDLGPNRKYYSVTEKGRNFYKELNEYFNRNNIDVFRDFSDNEAQEEKTSQISFENNTSYNSPLTDEKENEEETNDYFDFSMVEEDNTQEDIKEIEENTVLNITNEHELKEEKEEYTQVEQVTSTNVVIENFNNRQENFNYFIHNKIEETTTDEVQQEIQEETNLNEQESVNESNLEIKEEIVQGETQIQEEKKDDAVFLSTQDANEYNKRLYDISKDINKLKKKRSFAEDQISMTVDSPLYLSNEKTKANIEDFRNSFNENKEKPQANKISQYDFARQMSYRYNENKSNEKTLKNTEESPVKDDAKLITNRIDSESVVKAKKIEPPRLKIVSEASRDSRLPAPKRDKSIDPSHKEILSRLYSKTKDGSTDNIRADALYDYNDLKDFYKGQNIAFSEYKKPIEKNYHNTNKLYLILSIITFLSASLISGMLYLILAKTNQLFNTVNFLYIVLPALLLIDVGIKFYNYKKYLSWLPSQMMPQWKMWCICLAVICCTIGLNVIFGFGYMSFDNYSTTLLLPISLILILLPIRYYVKRFILIKFWK